MNKYMLLVAACMISQGVRADAQVSVQVCDEAVEEVVLKIDEIASLPLSDGSILTIANVEETEGSVRLRVYRSGNEDATEVVADPVAEVVVGEVTIIAAKVDDNPAVMEVEVITTAE